MTTPAELNAELAAVFSEAAKCRGCYPSSHCVCSIDATDADLLIKLHDILKRMDWIEQARQQVYVSQVKEVMRAQQPKVYEEGLVALTVRPEDGSLVTCQEIVERIKRIKAINRMSYVFEQVGEDPEGEPHGWHIHASITTTSSPSHIKTYVGQATFLKKRGTIVCSVCTKKADRRWEENYMKGDKHNESKDPAVRCNVVFREKLGLEALYVFEKPT